MGLSGWSQDFAPTNTRRRTAAILNFVKNTNISVLDKDICTQFHIKEQDGLDYRQELQDVFSTVWSRA